MKKETLEEVTERLYPIIETDDYMDWYDKNYDIRNAFIEGAKWQQERSYSEEEVIGFLADRERDLRLYDMYNDYEDTFKWFEQFKKKLL